MEQLLHYTWKLKLFPLKELLTSDGMLVEVIDPGKHNSDAGPDFVNAKVRINGTMWAGNVEIHDKSSDWYVHGHDKNSDYDNVILHVAKVLDTEVMKSNGQYVQAHYDELRQTEEYPACYKVIPDLPSLTIHSWMAALQVERLERKTSDIRRRVERCNGSWEDGYFTTLARNYGFGINGDVFEQWAQNVPLSAARRFVSDRGYLLRSGRIAGARCCARVLPERGAQRWLLCPIAQRVPVSGA